MTDNSKEQIVLVETNPYGNNQDSEISFLFTVAVLGLEIGSYKVGLLIIPTNRAHWPIDKSFWFLPK